MKAILYDLDGVLVDACQIHYQALNRALRESVFNIEISRSEHEANFNGLPTNQKLNKLFQARKIKPGGQGNPHWNFINSRKQKYTLDAIAELELDAQKVELHKEVKKIGLSIGCVTNSIRVSAETMLRNTGQLEFIDVLISNQDVSQGKPSPEGYFKAMEILQMVPHDCLIVEDSILGLEAARATGAAVLSVRNATEVTWPNMRTWVSL